MTDQDVLYEDNHLIAINKKASEIVQADQTGDEPMEEEVKAYLKEKYDKPGNVFCGVIHRIDRPVSGVVLFAKTDKALSRMNELLREQKIEKTYWAIVGTKPEEEEARLENYLVRNAKQNKTYVYDYPKKGGQKAALSYKLIGVSNDYYLLKVLLETGRHHQIRAQLAHEGFPIKGDLKYGAPRSNPNGGISLHARSLAFIHPVSGEEVYIEAPVPGDDALWQFFEQTIKD